MPLEDDDSFHEKPPRLSEIPADDKENYTLQSIEDARDRLASRRFDRESFGTLNATELFGIIGDGKMGEEEDEEESDQGEEDQEGMTTMLDEITKRTLAE